VTVTDVLLQTVLTLVNLGGRRLGLGGTEGEKDLEQARLAIDATRALVDLLPPDQTAPIKDALSQLQMAYAREARASPQSPEASPQGEDAGEAERAKARSKLWTPPGT
jgi:hypothetical protein